jgi:hypothetical protein
VANPPEPEPEAFQIAPDDPLAEEHAAVSSWVEEAFGSLSKFNPYQDVDLKSFPSGQRLLGAKPDPARRYVLAAVEQVRHWDRLADRIRAQAKSEIERINAHFLPGWGPVEGRRRQAAGVIVALMRRALPLEKPDLIAILSWCQGAERLTSQFAPIGHITRALERHASTTPVDPELREAMRRFASLLRASRDKDIQRLGTTVEQLCVDESCESSTDAAPAAEIKPPPTPSPAGSPGVLEPLKRLYGMLPDDLAASTTPIEPDRFLLGANSPLRREHELLGALFEEVVGRPGYHTPNLAVLEAGKTILALDPEAMGRVVLAAAERQVQSVLAPKADYSESRIWQSRAAVAEIMSPLLKSRFEVGRDGLFDLLVYLSARLANERQEGEKMATNLIEQAEAEAARSPLTEGERYVLSLFRTAMMPGPALGSPSAEVERLTGLIGDGVITYLTTGEAWSEAVNNDLARLGPSQRARWVDLLQHALTATSARPSGKWLTQGRKLVEAIGGDDVRDAMLRWMPMVGRSQTTVRLPSYPGDARGAGSGDVMNEENANALRGLLWLTQVLPGRHELARAITAVALSAYKKVPGIGPRAVKVGNAAVYALSEMGSTDAVGQLAILKVRVKFGTAQKEIEKAFTTSAEALGLARDQIEEMGVPSYGLEEVGRRSETLGDHRAELIVTGSDAELKWFDAGGKPLKSVPARVKEDHKDELKELQQSLKDIQSMLPAQRDRIDSMFLLQKTWPFEEWRERYLDHPLVGTIARRLIWCIDGTPAFFIDGRATDVQGEPIEHGRTAEITMWHPVGRGVDEITAWRRRLEDMGITQPFKQAHREVYPLTDAERNTRTYSNRFAAHIIRQHQFNALCAVRGWKNKLRLMVDSTFPPAIRELPQWGLRAEFWIEGVGDDHGTDTNDAGVYLRLSTDQVRFYRIDAARNEAQAGSGSYSSHAVGPGTDNINEPMPIEQVPPLAFSEVMRDVDLFVGVASIGNDPSWQDGGPEGRYRQYWNDYAFGELSGTAATRKQVLERLVPRLKIADRCSFADRFLVVRGRKRTYKIHLGSGNILMEPNDQYLCIVPDSRSSANPGELFLPFEGDSTLSIIISKAMLLADDTKIKDPTITRQIDAR